ncbi:preprotein translocase subunit SecE [Flavobacterium lacus]|uniref:Protein translocase subunit SecE n=2 Tax=Flavobacterium lacus TaxID=1353778 RepID=A0A328WST8_9FLAO|nr:preprotein translocase subunit SecE [Flavobacterium lacus]
MQNSIIMTKVVNYITEAFQELKSNVTWLPWSEVQRLTIIVAVFTIVFSLATWGVDEVFRKAISGFFNLIKG